MPSAAQRRRSSLPASLAAAEVGQRRNGLRQQVGVDMRRAALECVGRLEIDGHALELWDKIAGLYRCGAGDAGSTACGCLT